MSRKSALRTEYEMLRWVKDFAREHCIPAKDMAEIIREHRRTIHRIDRDMVDPLAQSIRDDWRHSYREDGEGGIDYAIMEDTGFTDEEIEDFIDSEVGYPPICSPYDCTGRRFTWAKDWKRTAAGVVMIHRWSLDV